MSKVLTAFGAASLLALTACGGGGSEAEVNNTAATDELTLPADENVAIGDTLGDQANALDANLTTDSNLTTDANLTVNTTDANVSENVANSQ
jgi:RNA 3'-terminal phosphate cyclase